MNRRSIIGLVESISVVVAKHFVLRGLITAWRHILCPYLSEKCTGLVVCKF